MPTPMMKNRLIRLVVLLLSTAAALPIAPRSDTYSAFPNSTATNPDIRDLIVGGQTATAGVPLMAQTVGSTLCEATLIHTDILLTAAHCQGTFISAGITLGGNTRFGGTFYSVLKELPHPKFQKLTFQNDIMLVKISGKAPKGTPFVALNKFSAIPAIGSVVTVLGYGYTSEGGPSSGTLQSVGLPTQSDARCLNVSKAYTPGLMMCLGGLPQGGKDSCNGDSGGPAMFNQTQVGIVSFGIVGCARPNIPASYTRISTYLSWIQKNLCTLSRYPPASCFPTATPSAAPIPAAPSTQLPIPEISGLFNIQVVVRFDNIKSFSSQAVFDFGNGPAQDNIVLRQCDTTADMCFQIWKTGKKYELRAVNAIKARQEVTWKVGVYSNGTMWIDRNGVRIATGPGVVPGKVPRVYKLLGRSTWAKTTPLQGAILGLYVSAGVPGAGNLFNYPKDIGGAFSVAAYARFDNLAKNCQHIFDFGNGATLDNINFGQNRNTSTVIFRMWSGTTVYQVRADRAIEQGVLAHWKCGVDNQRIMYIEKDGNRIAEALRGLPPAVHRNSTLVGYSNSPGDSPLQGIVVGLNVSRG